MKDGRDQGRRTQRDVVLRTEENGTTRPYTADALRRGCSRIKKPGNGIRYGRAGRAGQGGKWHRRRTGYVRRIPTARTPGGQTVTPTPVRAMRPPLRAAGGKGHNLRSGNSARRAGGYRPARLRKLIRLRGDDAPEHGAMLFPKTGKRKAVTAGTLQQVVSGAGTT